MGGRKLVATLTEVAVVVTALIQITSAATYTVGDNMGWNTPSNGANTYANWASKHTYKVGDSLVFNFATGVHTAAEVSADSYNKCNTGNIINLQSSGPATFTLNSVGTMYFICTVHCSQGQKFSIDVVSSGNTNAPPGVYVPPPPPLLSNGPTIVIPFFIICLSIALTVFLNSLIFSK